MKVHKYVLSGFLFFIICMPIESLYGDIIDALFFSNKGYASCIKVHGWVVTEDQVAEAFTTKEDPIPLPCRELNKKNLYFLIRLENLDYLRAWGALFIDCPEIRSTTIEILNVDPCINKGGYYAIFLGNHCFSQSKYDITPRLFFKWKKLYVK